MLEVTDDGPGIPADELPPPVRAVPHDQAGGTGLGLAIARRIVEEHGGEVAVVSAPGRTVFRVELPSRREAAAPGLATAAPRSRST
jgi:signal transduction histidine kinase